MKTIIEKNSQEKDFSYTVEKGEEILFILKINEPGVFSRIFKVETGAKLTIIDLQIGVGVTERKTNIVVELVGEGAEVNLLGLFAGQGHDSLNINHSVKHAAPRTVSKLESRGILTDAAFAEQISSIAILPNQMGCKGDERADTVLLSDNARVVAVPELEISNNDVQCKHAVTTTRLNAEKLFYLTSRGLSETDSRALLVEAHMSPILEQIPSDVLLELNLDFSAWTWDSKA